MPQLHHGIYGFTYTELTPFYPSRAALIKQIQRDKDRDEGLKILRRACYSKDALIHIESLPAHILNAIGDPRQVKHPFEKYYKRDKDALRFFTSYQFEKGAYLSTEYQDRYLINASVLQTVLAFRTDLIKERKHKGLNCFGIDEVLRNHSITFKKTLKAKHSEEHTLPEGEKAFKKALKEFEKSGYDSLISGKHGNNNSRKVTDNTMALLEGMFAKDSTKPTATEVYRRYSDFLACKIDVISNTTGEVFNPALFNKLSDSTIKKYLSAWESAIGTNALRSGDRQKLMQRFKPYHSLKKPVFAGSIISIDDRQPPFKMPDGNRPWFYNAIDLASEAFTCFVYGKSKEGIILEFYRQLVRNYAEWGFCLPAELECESSLNSSYKDTFLREGAMFQHVRIEANNARGKAIERYYGQLRYGLEKKREGWLARPFAISESKQAGSHQVRAMYYEDIIQGCIDDINTWNAMPHSVHKHLTRWEVFIQNQHDKLTPINYNAILPHLGNKTTTSCHTGIIKLQYDEFLLGENGEVCTERDRLISFMKRVEGNTVDLYWLDGNNGEVLKALVFIGTQLICEAVPKPMYNRAKIEQTPDDEKAREIMSKYVAIIEAFGKSRKQAIEGVTIVDNTPLPKKTFTLPGSIIKKAFTMTGLNPLPVYTEATEVEIMPEPVNEYEFVPEQTTTRTLKERF